MTFNTSHSEPLVYGQLIINVTETIYRPPRY